MGHPEDGPETLGEKRALARNASENPAQNLYNKPLIREPFQEPFESRACSRNDPPGVHTKTEGRWGGTSDLRSSASVWMGTITQTLEASLRRTAGRAAAGDSQVTDLDKIHIQLCLDIDVFTKTAATMGVIKDSSAGLTQLHEKVSTVWPTYLQHRPAAS